MLVHGHGTKGRERDGCLVGKMGGVITSHLIKITKDRSEVVSLNINGAHRLQGLVSLRVRGPFE